MRAQATEFDDCADTPDDLAGDRNRSTTRPSARTLWGEPLRRLIAIALALFATAAAIAGPVAVRVHGISVFDEATHIDYAYQVAHGHIPARGSIIAPAIRTELVCRGSARANVAITHCGEVNPPASEFAAGAQDYNFGHPPLYYAITGVLARIAGSVTSGQHFTLFARLVGVLWLFAAMLVLYLALRRFAVRWPIAAGTAAMLAASPAIFYPAATVTNDAAAALAGSLAVLVLAGITAQGKLGWKIPALLALLAAATKILNAVPLLAVAAVVLVLGLRDWRTNRARALQLLRITLGILGGVLIVYVGWTLFQNHRGVPHWVSPIAGGSSRPVSGAPFDELFSTSFSTITLLSSGYVPPLLSNSWLTILLRVWGPLGVGAMVAVLAVHRTWTPRFTLAACTAIALIAVPWVVEFQVYASGGRYFPAIVPRYATSLVPLVLACIGVLADDRRLVKSLAVFAGGVPGRRALRRQLGRVATGVAACTNSVALALADVPRDERSQVAPLSCPPVGSSGQPNSASQAVDLDDRADTGADARAEGSADVFDNAPTSAGRTLWGEPLRRLIAIALALFATAAAIAGPAAVRVHGISPFDEATHIDYAYQVAHGHIPARGSIIAPAIRTELVCRGPARKTVALKLCGQVNPPATAFAVGAQNYNFGHPPLYYAITGVLARIAGSVTSGQHFTLFARLVGILWLFAAMLVLYLALRRFAVRWPIAAGTAAMLAASPAIFYPAATVTNDAAAALAGSLAVLVLAGITAQGKLGWKIPALLALLAAATKILNAVPLLAVAAVVLVLGLRDWRTNRARALQLLRITLGILGGVLIVYVGWTLFQNHRGVPHWVSPIAGVSQRPVSGAPFDELFSTSFSTITLLSSGYVPPLLSNSWLTILLRVWGPLGVGAMVAVLAVHRTWTPRFTLAACTAIGLIAVPWVVELQAYTTAGAYFPIVVSRYRIAFIPLILACIGVLADDRQLRKSITTFTGACLAVALYTVLWAG